MAYNMYDKDYGSGFTPESDNRPEEQRPNYHYGFQPEDDAAKAYTVPPRPNHPPKKPHQPSKAMKYVAGGLAALILCGGAGAGGAYLMMSSMLEKNPDAAITTDAGSTSADVTVSDRDSSKVTVTPVAAGNAMTPSQIYDTYSKAVASIQVQTANGISAGTGFVIDAKNGYLLTCYHVIKGYQAISCTFDDSTSFEATYVGGDEDSDLAVLKIDPKDTQLTQVVVGDSSALQIGGTVTAIGNALGTFSNTLTSGTVSGLDRALTMSDGTVLNVLQTDCTVNSGNSGGPLFNEFGEVIGVVNAKYSNSGYSTAASVEGIGFAIPINDAMNILDDLIAHGYITGKPYLGISVATVSSITAQQYSNMVVGAYVRSVNEGSCAEKGGLQVGDIITQVNGKDITTYEELIDAKNTMRAGDEMNLTVYREGTYLTIVVTLDEEVPQSAAGETEEQTQQGGSYYGGDGSQGQMIDPYSYFNDFFGGRR